jgi:hypothetical protein
MFSFGVAVSLKLWRLTRPAKHSPPLTVTFRAAGKRVVIPEYDFAANARSADGGTQRYFEHGTKVLALPNQNAWA